jgi:FtsH-binding integral membrane protein
MLAALAVAPAATPDSSLFAAVIVAAAVTALVALAMMLFGMQRTHNLTGLRALATAGIAVAVISVAIGGVFAVSPSPAQASPNDSAPTFTYSTTDSPDIQLPTLPLGG